MSLASKGSISIDRADTVASILQDNSAIFVLDSISFNLTKFSPDGKVLWSLPTPKPGPYDFFSVALW